MFRYYSIRTNEGDSLPEAYTSLMGMVEATTSREEAV